MCACVELYMRDVIFLEDLGQDPENQSRGKRLQLGHEAKAEATKSLEA